MGNNFSQRQSSDDIPFGFVSPTLSFEQAFCLICGRRRMVVNRHRMVRLVLEKSIPFMYVEKRPVNV